MFRPFLCKVLPGLPAFDVDIVNTSGYRYSSRNLNCPSMPPSLLDDVSLGEVAMLEL